MPVGQWLWGRINFMVKNECPSPPCSYLWGSSPGQTLNPIFPECQPAACPPSLCSHTGVRDGGTWRDLQCPKVESVLCLLWMPGSILWIALGSETAQKKSSSSKQANRESPVASPGGAAASSADGEDRQSHTGSTSQKGSKLNLKPTGPRPALHG